MEDVDLIVRTLDSYLTDMLSDNQDSNSYGGLIGKYKKKHVSYIQTLE